MKTKTKKTPLMTAETFGLTFCSSRLVIKRKRLHSLEAQYGFVPKPSRHGGKTVKTERRSHNCFCGFSFLLLKAAGCFLFQQLRRQAGLHSRMHEWKTNGCNPSTTEKGLGGFC